MADTTYVVRVRYEFDDRNARFGASQLATTFDRLSAAAAAAFSAHKLLEFGRRIMALQGEAENLRVALASLLVGFQAPGFTKGANDFQKAMGASQILMQQIYADAAKLPGTAEDLMDAMRGAMPGGLQTGHAVMGKDSILDMAKRLVTASWLLQIPGGTMTASREFQAMMEGRAMTRNDLFARLRGLMSADGNAMSAKQFNALSEKERWEAVERALKRLVDPSIETYANTWKAISTTTLNWSQQILRIATGGAFESIKKHLKDLNEWIGKNYASIGLVAKAFSDWLTPQVNDAFDKLKDVFKFIYENRVGLIEVAKAFAALAAFDKLGGLTMLGYGRGMNGRGLNNNTSSGAGALLGYTVSSLTGGGTFENVVGGLLGLLMTLGGNIGLVSAALLGLVAATNLATTAIDQYHKDDINKNVESKRLMGLYKDYERIQGWGGDPLVDSRLYHLGRQIIQENRLNVGYMGSIDNERFGDYVGGLTKLDMIGAAAARKFLNAVAKKMHDESVAGPRMPTEEEKLKQLLLEGNRARGATPRKADVNVTVNIKQDISQAEDPDRILVRTKKALEDALIRPIETGHNRFSILR